MLINFKRGRRIIDIPLVRIRPCKTQVRRKYNPELLKELAISIKQNGILQPLTVRKVSSAEYELISGERRLRAAAMCGKSKVPCIVISCSDSQASIYSLTENLQRSEINIFEEAQGITEIMSHYHMSKKETARKLGKRPSVIEGRLSILDLSAEERELIIKAHLSERHARALLILDDPTDRRIVLSEVIEKKMNVSQTEKFIQEYIEQIKIEHFQKLRRKAVLKDMKIIENTLNKALDTISTTGISALTDQSENEQYIEYTVRIMKPSPVPFEKRIS